MKKIKRTYKIIFLALLIAIAVPATAYIVLQSGYVQTLIVHFLTNEISENIKAKINIGSVKISFFNRIRLQNLYFEDQNSDTLLFAEEVFVNIRKIDKKNRVVAISKMELENAVVNFYVDSSRTLNLKFIIDELKQNKRKRVKKGLRPMELNFRNIAFTNSEFKFRGYHQKKTKTGINFGDLHLQNMNMDCENLNILGGAVNMDIKNLVFEDKSGFSNKSFSGHLNLTKTQLKVEDVHFQTSSTNLKGRQVGISFDDFSNLSDGTLYDNVIFDIDLIPSLIDFTDLAYVAPGLQNMNQIATIGGKIYGNLGNLKGKDVQIYYGIGTNIQGDFNINGLPGIDDAFLYVDIENFTTHHDDLETFILPLSPELTDLPDNIKNLGRIRFKGKFTGFVEDFVTYGSFHTALGSFSTDLLFKPLKKGVISYSGNMKTKNFELGHLLDKDHELMGEITLDANVNGTIQDEQSIDAHMEGQIQSFMVNGYNYENITLSGTLQDNSFDGDLVVSDPNCNLEFNGRISFSDKRADFDFNANVTQANLYKLNIDRSDPSSFASFLIEANGTGRNLDEFNGEIKLLNSFFSKRDKQVQLYDFRLMANNTLDTSKITIKSDFLDAEITGKYEFQYLKGSLKYIINKFIPSLYTDYQNYEHLEKNDFVFKGKFKNTKSFTNFFFPKLSVAENTFFEASYSPNSSTMLFHAESEELGYKNMKWQKIYVDAFSEDSLLSVESGSKHFAISNKIELENYSMYLNMFSDSIDFLSRWHNWDTVLYKGTLKAHGKFQRDTLNKVFLDMRIPSSEIIMGDSIWNLQTCNLWIDSSTIKVDTFKIKRDQQEFLVTGEISKEKDRQLRLAFNDFKISNFNILTKGRRMVLDGILHGESTISNVYNNLTFSTDLRIDQLNLNNEDIGNTYIKSTYLANKNSIGIHAFSMRGSLKTLELKGDYHPNNQNLDFIVRLNKLRNKVLNPFTEGIASDINGIASGKLAVTGTIKQPLLNGQLDFNKTSFVIDYLNTKYSFSDVVKVANNQFLFDDITIFDHQGNGATLNGGISNDYFRNLSLNLNLEAEDFLFLNTSYSNNESFYGTAYATGEVRLTGDPDNITFDVQATTNENTRFYIPLNADEEVASYDFVRFVNPDAGENNAGEENLKHRDNISGLKLNFDLDITPDAEVQLIFDSKVGDIIRSRGSGAINLEINTAGKFNMFGDYTIAEGDYLFTLQNVINKKFVIEEGGYITWNGNPMDANINLTAIYNAKAKLSELFPDEENEYYKTRIPVECQIELTNRLVNPDLNFDIHLPTADPDTRNRVTNSINTEEELSRHFLSLLVINSFMIDPNRVVGSDSYKASYSAPGAIGVTTSELFSNQLSHWLSQMSNEFDVGINYRPGDAITTKEVELALSTKILNDRVSINGNLDVGGKNQNITTQTSNIVGDFDVDVKINKSGKLHVKAFNKANDNFIKYSSDYTQGVGIFFREEFDSLEELLAKYLRKINGADDEEQDNEGTSNGSNKSISRLK